MSDNVQIISDDININIGAICFIIGESICDGFCKTLWALFYPYEIKFRAWRQYPGCFGPGSFPSGHFGLSHPGQCFCRLGLYRWVVSA